MKVGVKFCGGCNPYIDRKQVNDRVKDLLIPQGYVFEYFDFKDCDAFLVINGCSLSCARYEESDDVVTVAGYQVDGQLCREEDLPLQIVRRMSTVTTKNI
jgi:hypothetical protein